MPNSDAGRLQVGVVVGELDSMVTFYGEALGLDRLDDLRFSGGTIARFSAGGAGIKLVALDDPPETANPPGGIGGKARGLRYLTLRVDDAAATAGRCESAGGKVVVPVFDHEGSPMAVVEDPEGNWIELLQ